MSKSGFQVDDTQVKIMFDALTSEEMKKVGLSALRKGAVILQKETERRFKSKINIDNRKVTVTKSNGKTKEKIRRIAALKVLKKEMAVKVHIMSDFRLKFFEQGTKTRETKGRKNLGSFQLRKGGRKYTIRTGKGRRTGSIKAGWFFKDAKASKEKEIFDSLDSTLSKEIIRISKKKTR